MTKREAWERWKADPALFAREALGVDPWSKQIEILRAVRDHPRVAVKSGHKVGKSTSAAILALWFASFHKDARVILTSASARQIRSILWREIKRLVRNADSRCIDLGANVYESPDSGIQWKDGREIVGFSTNEPERMAGISGENVLFIPDEASGIPDEIFEAIEGNRAGGARLVMFSNPTRSVGEFYAAFHGKREFYKTISVSSATTPNATGIGKLRPGLAGKEWVAEKKREWGEGSLLYQVRVEGAFGSQSERAVIGLALLEQSLEAWKALQPDDHQFDADVPLDIGVDVARYGDDESVIAFKRGNVGYPARVYRNLDGLELAAQALQVARDHRGNAAKVRIKIDSIGVGASPFDALKADSDGNPRLSGLTVYPVNVGAGATVPGYMRLRDQVVYELKEWLKDGGALCEDPTLEAELVAYEYSVDLGGKIKVTSKDDLKKTLGRSPDRADAFALAAYTPQGGSIFIG